MVCIFDYIIELYFFVVIKDGLSIFNDLFVKVGGNCIMLFVGGVSGVICGIGMDYDCIEIEII